MITDPAVNVACQAFLKVMLQESRKRYPNRPLQDHTVPDWDILAVRERQTLQRAMAAALAAAHATEKAKEGASQ